MIETKTRTLFDTVNKSSLLRMLETEPQKYEA